MSENRNLPDETTLDEQLAGDDVEELHAEGAGAGFTGTDNTFEPEEAAPAAE